MMRKAILSSLVIGLLGLSAFALARWNTAYQKLERQTKSLTAERDQLAAKLTDAETLIADLKTAAFVTQPTEAPHAAPADQAPLVEAEAAPPFRGPQITVDPNGKKSYFFPELQGADGKFIARSAQFRELLGYTKLSFRTSDGIRYFDLDDLHSEVVRALGYDAAILKRRLSDEARLRQALGAQAQLQQELRTKAALEQAEREKAAAERIKAEAALRDAQARERLAEAAERNASNPPQPPRITQKVIVVPYGRILTNPPEPQPKQ